MSKWEKVKFEDLIEDKTRLGFKIKKEDYLPQGNYPVIDQGQEYVAGYINTNKGIFNDVPAIIFGDHTRIIKYVDIPFFLGADGVKLLKCKSQNTSYKYLYYYFLKNEVPNTGYNRHFKWLKELLIPLPPYEVQNQIAQNLDTVSELLVLRKKQLEELDGLIKSVFYDMFGDPVLNKMRWATQPMLKVGKFVSGGTPSKERNDYWIGNFPWVSPKDMKVPYILNSQNYISNNVFEETSLKKIPPGHLLIVVRGMILTHSFPTAINTVEVSINQDMKAILPIDELNVVYLKHCLDNMTHQILKIITTAGHGTKKFNTDSMGKVFIPVPPLSLQNQFTSIVTKFEEQKSLVKQSIEETQTLFDSLMSQYFDD